MDPAAGGPTGTLAPPSGITMNGLILKLLRADCAPFAVRLSESELQLVLQNAADDLGK